ncbi:(protein release factor)-glutamine N5-methyltransferase [Desulfitobacterium dichloroeliminans LMG P-21439]|uniref:Release factor glutamine methyltransferase n=1 Tax=Desulfitobacterium dichloroeliminans (strain LMG P-21439 / DCA1) TaxID=871963 RepID=L0FC93_DESDL|nr:peptide chain release factor N(5)-glutamine methyltransferase [Desulfitobacterium dichloroeliminans]AGA70842.1 (protein release factor)-glutamine N5-methyltransferase [Desulfitobacterium dichloroeliminans LMG P-21439]
MRIVDALLWGEQELKLAQVENPRWDADLLLGYILKLRREQLYLGRDQLLAPDQEVAFAQVIERRVKREPLQYILRHQEFMGLDFYVDKRVLIPRADSEILVEKVLELKRAWSPTKDGSPPAIVDLCTGSGALAISVAHYWPEARVVGTDLSPNALAVARLNSERLGVRVEWREGDFLAPIRGQSWDIIISNPPYIAEGEYTELAPEIAEEPRMAFLGGVDGLDFYRELAREAPALLKASGRIIVEIGWQQSVPVTRFLQELGLTTEVFQDLGGRDRVVFARCE